MDNEAIKWFDIAGWGVEGKGWAETKAPFDRLPARAEGVVPDAVWNLSHSGIGMCSHFNTNSTRIYARWKLAEDQLGEDNFNVCGYSGVDLYGFDGKTKRWRWAGAPAHASITDKTPSTVLAEGLNARKRKYCLYLPLRNPVSSVEIGVDSDAFFDPLVPRSTGSLVYYGTSIVHGAYASRAGLGLPQILGRRLGRPLINLGFSGSAKMELEMAALIAELDAGVFILDALPNMNAEDVKVRAEPFIHTICAARPDTPVVLIEDAPNTRAWLKPQDTRLQIMKWKVFSEVYTNLRKRGFKHLHYVKGERLFGVDGEASVDGIHPSDLGSMRMADFLEKAVRQALDTDR